MGKSKTSWFSKPNNILLFSIGCFFFLGMGYLALLFYQERMLNIDSAGFAFHLAQTGDFCIPLGRWGSIFSQILPLLYLKAGGDLDGFLKVYSLSFILLQFGGFLIVTIVLKETKAGLMYLLAACLTYRYSFYFSASEFAQGLNLCIILYAMVNAMLKSHHKKKRIILLLLSLLLVLMLYYFHQLLIVPVAFVLVFLAFKNRAYKSRFLWTILIFAILFFGLQLLMLPSSGYEAGKIPRLEQIKSGLDQFAELNSTKFYVIQIKTKFTLALLLAAISLVLLLKYRKWLMTLFVLLSSAAYFVLIAITYGHGESPNMYEQYFIAYGLFISITAVYAFGLTVRKKYLLMASFLVLIYSFQGMYHAHEIPTKRLVFLKHLVSLSKTHNTMIAIHPDNIQWGYVWTGWAVPVETLLISSLDGGESTSIYITDGTEKIEPYPKNGQLYAAPWQQDFMRSSALNKDVFKVDEPIKYTYIAPLSRDYNYYYDLIKYDFAWMEGIKDQAEKEDITIDETIKTNAAYMALTDKKSIKLPPLEQKKMEIRSSFEWMKNIKKKAKKSGKSVEQVIQEDALYLINQAE